MSRLVARRQSFGEPADAAAAWVHGVDQENAAVVEPSRNRADLIVQLITRLGDQLRPTSTISNTALGVSR